MDVHIHTGSLSYAHRENQGAENLKLFLREFKWRLIDCYQHDWHDKLSSNLCFFVYSLLKTYFA